MVLETMYKNSYSIAIAAACVNKQLFTVNLKCDDMSVFCFQLVSVVKLVA